MAKETLCWNCSNGANECCFMKSLEPVQGWEAKKTWCDGGWTYHVIKCPNVVSTRKAVREKKRTRRKRVRVRCIETGQVYPSIRQCAKEIHVSEAYVAHRLAGRVNIAAGLHFERV